MTENAHEAIVDQLWCVADKNGKGELDGKELSKLFMHVNLDISKKNIQNLMNTASDGSGKGTVGKAQFHRIINHVSDRKDLRYIFQFISNGKELASVDSFSTFLRDIQKVEEGKIKGIITKIGDIKSGVSYAAFLKYIKDDENKWFKPDKQKITMPMNHPIQNYFVMSSHNTYLMGDQLRGKSSVDAYIKVLKFGCKSVELDCWDGPDEPVIYHGHTLTSKITFREVIEAVKQYAFVVSPYPLTLSIENHCSHEQQVMMAKILKNVLGNILLTVPLSEDIAPSPENLKNKVLVKGKPHKPAVFTSTPVPLVEEDSDDSDDESNFKNANKIEKVKHGEIVQELGMLAVYMVSRKLKALDDKTFTHKHIASLSEKKASKLIAADIKAIVSFNNQAFTRIYPQGLRVDSSNIQPLNYWQSGCQMAAINFQTFDIGSQLNRGLFLQNGGCGYVLKPDYLLNGTLVPKVKPMKIAVLVISAFRLPKPRNEAEGEIIDPYVVVDLITPNMGKASVSKETFRTRQINDNGFMPNWFSFEKYFPHSSLNKFGFNFKTTVEFPELSFLRFSIMDKDLDFKDDYIGSANLPVDCIQPGYRLVSLWDHEGNVLPHSDLFVYISFQ